MNKLLKFLLIYLVVVSIFSGIVVYLDKKLNHSKYFTIFAYFISTLNGKSSEFRPYKEEVSIIKNGLSGKTKQIVKRMEVISVDDQKYTLFFLGKNGEFSAHISPEEIKQHLVRILIRDLSKKEQVSWVSDEKDSLKLSDYFCIGDFVEFIEKDEYIPKLENNIHVKYYFILNRLEGCLI